MVSEDIDRNDGKKLPINERIKKKNMAERPSFSPPPVRKVLHLEKNAKNLVLTTTQKSTPNPAETQIKLLYIPLIKMIKFDDIYVFQGDFKASVNKTGGS
jgi:hypothetical protein